MHLTPKATICCGSLKMAHRVTRPRFPLRSSPSETQLHRTICWGAGSQVHGPAI